MDTLFCDLNAVFLQKVCAQVHEAEGFSLMVSEHQALEELPGLQLGFSFGKPRFPGQFLNGLRIEAVIEFCRQKPRGFL